MKEIAKLMGYSKETKVLDATLRDGGLVNDFFFPEDFAAALYRANLKAGVDYMEFGYKADKELFDVEKFGPCKFCDDDYVRSVVGDNMTDLKLSVMADVGRCNYKEDIRPKNESPIDMIRVATYLNTIPAAVDMIEDAAKKGYETTCNIMAISSGQQENHRVALEALCQSPVDVLYIVDSFGSFYPEQISRVVDTFMDVCAKYGKKLGMHAHNNQQLAFANTIEAVGDGVQFLDATYNGMGRGAGNCSMELLLGMLHNPKYYQYPVIEFVEKHMNKLKENGVVWGYDLQYMMTGILNQHPRTAIQFTKDGRTDYAEFYKELTMLD
ncbi:MAG: aldolase catalytic domain-containing protein [Lachnospiraceae bacterium]|nr:aldolase catalytic domain-containing protein [Lachnospiraceae bacterium]